MPLFIGKLTPPDTGRGQARPQYAIVEAASRADALNAFRCLATSGSVRIVKGAVGTKWVSKAKRTRSIALLGAEVG